MHPARRDHIHCSSIRLVLSFVRNARNASIEVSLICNIEKDQGKNYRRELFQQASLLSSLFHYLVCSTPSAACRKIVFLFSSVFYNSLEDNKIKFSSSQTEKPVKILTFAWIWRTANKVREIFVISSSRFLHSANSFFGL